MKKKNTFRSVRLDCTGRDIGGGVGKEVKKCISFRPKNSSRSLLPCAKTLRVDEEPSMTRQDLGCQARSKGVIKAPSQFIH